MSDWVEDVGNGYYRRAFTGGTIWYYERDEDGRLVRYCVGLETRIKQKYGSLGMQVMGRPSASSKRTADNRAVFSRFGNGRIYAVDGTNEAFWIHGDIRTRWSELGEGASILGYPTTDETSTPDGMGRYNHFENGPMYWTPDTGACELRAPIRDRWAAPGWESSYLGYPVSGEIATDQGGKVVGFQRGEIRWAESLPAIDVPQSVTLADRLITPDGIAVSGDVHWYMNSRGDWTWRGHVHDSGFIGYNMAVATRLNFVDPTGVAHAAPPTKGHIDGTRSTGDNPNHFWDEKGNSSAIRNYWDKGVSSMGITTRVEVDATVSVFSQG